MWLDKAYLRQLVAKAAAGRQAIAVIASSCAFDNGAPSVEGFGPCTLLSTGNLAARQAGTVIATGHMTAAITYWR